MMPTQVAGRAWILVLGEDENDRLVIRSFCEKFCPTAKGAIKTLGKPVPKLRDASAADLAERAKDVAAAVAAEAVDKNIGCVFVHEDLDTVGHEAYNTTRQRIQDALSAAFTSFGLTAKVVAIVAVEETEAWLLLFPDVLHGFRKDWAVPGSLRGIDTSLRPDPKGLLKTISRKSRNPYRERDAPLIAARIAEGPHGITGTNPSWSQFRAGLKASCP